MPICTFFGHRDCPESVKLRLREVLSALIESRSADTFYVGDSGAFDSLVRAVLRELSREYPHIRYAVVLAYMPKKREDSVFSDFAETLLPEGIEFSPPRFAISRRNEWMLKNADIVVAYITHTWGGAAQFAEIAKRRNKTVINIAEK